MPRAILGTLEISNSDNHLARFKYRPLSIHEFNRSLRQSGRLDHHCHQYCSLHSQLILRRSSSCRLLRNGPELHPETPYLSNIVAWVDDREQSESRYRRYADCDVRTLAELVLAHEPESEPGLCSKLPLFERNRN